MKEKEGKVDFPEQQVILYVEKDDGKFGPMQTGSYISANYMDDYNLKRRNLELSLRKQLAEGVISPVYFYMVFEDLTVSELAARAGIRKSRVKRHLGPKEFGHATIDELLKYSAVFNVPAANLLQVILISDNGDTRPAVIPESKPGRIAVGQTQTSNPYIVLTNIEERR